jgi:hypothetical protein
LNRVVSNGVQLTQDQVEPFGDLVFGGVAYGKAALSDILKQDVPRL